MSETLDEGVVYGEQDAAEKAKRTVRRGTINREACTFTMHPNDGSTPESFSLNMLPFAVKEYLSLVGLKHSVLAGGMGAYESLMAGNIPTEGRAAVGKQAGLSRSREAVAHALAEAKAKSENTGKSAIAAATEAALPTARERAAALPLAKIRELMKMPAVAAQHSRLFGTSGGDLLGLLDDAAPLPLAAE